MANKRFSVSIHDVAPGKRIEEIRSRLEDIGVEEANLLVVPDFHDTGDIDQNLEFAVFLNVCAGRGDELLLHGHYHKDFKGKYGSFIGYVMGKLIANGEAGYQDLTYRQAAERLRKSKDMLSKPEVNLWDKIKGFVPPWWQIRESAIKAVEEAGFEYIISATPAEIFLKQQVPIRWFDTGKVDRSYEISFEPEGFFCTFTRYYAKFAEWRYEGHPYLRIAIHPRDIENPKLFNEQCELIKRMFDSGRELVTYRGSRTD